MLKHGILGLISYHEMTGYEIMLVFRDSLSFFWSAQQSQIYRELQTLEANGWVDKTVVPQQGKPDKNVFSITEEGRKELLRWLAEDDLGLESHSPLLMRVFFMGERSREENIRWFEGLREYCSMFLKGLDQTAEPIRTYRDFLDAPEKALYWQMTVDYGRRNMQTYIEWAQNCIEQLKEGESYYECSDDQRKSQGGQEQHLEADAGVSRGHGGGGQWP